MKEWVKCHVFRRHQDFEFDREWVWQDTSGFNQYLPFTIPYIKWSYRAMTIISLRCARCKRYRQQMMHGHLDGGRAVMRPTPSRKDYGHTEVES